MGEPSHRRNDELNLYRRLELIENGVGGGKGSENEDTGLAFGASEASAVTKRCEKFICGAAMARYLTSSYI